jgi:hypothetical protein
MSAKTHQLQIRVTASEKGALKRLARAAGQDVSSYVLGRVLNPPGVRVAGLVQRMRDDMTRRFALAELHDTLASMGSSELTEAVAVLDVRDLTPLDQNYVAAMIEHVAHLRGLPPPPWTSRVAALPTPWFATALPGLRLHLLRSSPVAFKRRNLFVDATVGHRV